MVNVNARQLMGRRGDGERVFKRLRYGDQSARETGSIFTCLTLLAAVGGWDVSGDC